MDFSIEYSTSYDDICAIHDALYEYNLARTGAARAEAEAVCHETRSAWIIRGNDGKIYGGIAWHLVTGNEPKFVQADYFFIDDCLRGLGKGAELISRLEKSARECGAEYVALGTNTFQAPVFYAKMGYTELARRHAPTPALPDNEYYSFRKNIK